MTSFNVNGKTDPYVKPKPRLTLGEISAFGTIVDSLHNATTEELIETLEFLEEIVHHVDFGQQFAKTPAAIPTFITLLDHTDELVRSQALLVLGNALSVSQHTPPHSPFPPPQPFSPINPPPTHRTTPQSKPPSNNPTSSQSS